MVLFSARMHGLNIRDVHVSVISAKAINVSVNTEAVELYYFHSAHYAISGNAIIVEACYVEGFGSMIAYLNNNFEIPINTQETQNYLLTVKIYYTNPQVFYETQNLQDELSGMFSTPFPGQIVLEDTMFERESVILFPNPVIDYLTFSEDVKQIRVHDMTGRIVRRFAQSTRNIDLSGLHSGIYFIDFSNERRKLRQIIAKK